MGFVLYKSKNKFYYSWDKTFGNDKVVCNNIVTSAKFTLGFVSSVNEKKQSPFTEDNGNYTKIRIKDDYTTIMTDAAGSVPIYYGINQKTWAIGTSLTEVAEKTLNKSSDIVSVADFLLHETVVYPYTWFKNVIVLPPGSIIEIDKDGNLSSKYYWTPNEKSIKDKNIDINEWAFKLRNQVQNIINEATKNASKIRVLFSAGEDSRAVLSMIPVKHNPIPTMVSGDKNREYKIAKKAAYLMGYELDWIQRPENYYRHNIKEKISLVGPGRNISHMHFNYKIGEKINDADLIIGGYLADSMFKSNYMGNVLDRKFFPDVITSASPDRIKVLEKYSGYNIFKTEIIDEVMKRRNYHHNTLKTFRPNSAGHWHALWPISNMYTLPQYLGLHNIGSRILEPFFAHETYKLASEMPDKIRLNRAVFYRAFSDVMNKAGWHITSSGNIPKLGHGYCNSFLSGATLRVRSINDRINRRFGEEMSFGKDTKGWEPINIKELFNKEENDQINIKLNKIVKAKYKNEFFNNKEIPLKIRMRALQLSFGQ